VEGLGSTGCVCGALNAAVFMLSTKLGRTDSSSSSKNAEKSAASIVNAFKGEHGSTCCRVITKKASKVFGIGRYSTCPACVRTALRAMLKELHSENLLVIK
jgi:C_GCAxxG_C_C family probable redox protein